jgi:hypothetical protein
MESAVVLVMFVLHVKIKESTLSVCATKLELSAPMLHFFVRWTTSLRALTQL